MKIFRIFYHAMIVLLKENVFVGGPNVKFSEIKGAFRPRMLGNK